MTIMPLWLLLTVLVLATYRATRLVTRDELPLVKIPRDHLANWLDPRDPNHRPAGSAPLGGLGRAIAYLVECDWCSSVWVAAAVTTITTATVGLPAPWLMWPAVAAAAGLLAAGEQRLEQRTRHTELQITEQRAELRRRGAQV